MRKRILYLFLLLGFLLPAALSVQGREVVYTATEQKNTTVYITKSGEKYHRAGCRYVAKSKMKTKKKEAVGRLRCVSLDAEVGETVIKKV